MDRLFCKLSNLGNRIILGQDKRVVLTQQPKKTDMAMGEKLFQADRPIVAYRQRRKKFIEEEKRHESGMSRIARADHVHRNDTKRKLHP